MKKIYIIAFSFLITLGLSAQDLALDSILTPQAGEFCQLTDSETVSVIVKNTGSTTINSFDITFVTANDTVTENVVQTINAGDIYTYTFTDTADLSMAGEQKILIYTDLSGDTDHSNDSLSNTIINNDAQITVRLKTDAIPTETWMEIYDMYGTLVWSAYPSKEKYDSTYVICVQSNNCYKFKIYDSSGDGIAAGEAGSLDVYYEGLKTGGFSSSDANFGSKYTIYHMATGCPPDLVLQSINMESLSIAGEKEIKGTLLNFGSDTIKSYDVVYTIDDDSTSSVYTVSGVEIAPNKTANFTHDLAFNFSDAKIYKLSLTVSNANGSPVDDTPADNTLEKEIQIVAAAVPKMVLHEVFTASTCPPCATANPVIDKVVYNKNEDIASLVKYQVNWPGSGDPYYTNEIGIRRGYYNINSVPTFKVNGINTENGNYYSQSKLDNYATETSCLVINGTAEVTGSVISLNVDFTSKTQIKGTKLRARFAVVETKTVGNVGTNGEKEFHNVMMTMLPDPYGYVIQAFDSTEKTQNVQLNKDLKNTFIEGCTDLKLVAWLQNDETKEVYQSAYIPILFNESTLPNPVADFEFDATEEPIISFENTTTDGYRYIWNFGDNKTSTRETPKKHEYTQNKTYKVTLIAKNFCRDTVTKSITITKVGVGINELSKKEISLYPNPSNGVLHITNTEETDIIIYDMIGKIIYQKDKINTNFTDVDLSSYENGQYLVKIISKDKIYTNKILLIK